MTVFASRCHARAAFHAMRAHRAAIALRLVNSPFEVFDVGERDDGDLARVLGVDGRFSRALALETFIDLELGKAEHWTHMAEEQESIAGTVFPGEH